MSRGRGSLGAKLYLSGIPLAYDPLLIEELHVLTIDTEVGLVTNIGEFGRRFTIVTYQPVSTGRLRKLKGGYDDGGVDVQAAQDLSDDGQYLVKTFAETSDQNVYPFKIVFIDNDEDSEAVYFGARVMGFKTILGAAADFVRAAITLSVNTPFFWGRNKKFVFIPGQTPPSSPGTNLTFMRFIPNVGIALSGNATASPIRVDLGLSRFVPNVIRADTISPARLDLILSNNSPLFGVGVSSIPGHDDLAFSSFAPGIGRSVIISPARVDLTLSKSAPSLGTGTEIGIISWARLTSGVLAPSGNLSIQPARRDLTFTKSVPTIFASGGTLVATIVVNNVGGSSLPATSFWEFGQPFAIGDVPSGSIITADLDGSSVPIQAIARSTYQDGSLKWGLFQVDMSGTTITAGSSADLELFSSTGSWDASNSRTNANWAALVDTVELTNLDWIGGSGTNAMDKAGTWVASFDNGASNTVEVIGNSALGLRVKVYANFVNTGTTHRFLRASMEYWVCELSNGSLGPIASFGPCFDNTRMLLTDPSEFNFDANFKRNGSSQRIMTGIPCIGGSYQPLCRSDGQFDWSANESIVVLTRTISELRRTKKIPPYASGLAYDFVTETPIASISGSTFTVSTVNDLWPTTTYAIAVGFRTTGTIWGGGSTTTTYWARRASATTIEIYDTRAHATAGGATGRITPSSSGSGNIVRHDAAPASPGPICQGLENAGNRPDINLTTEWAAARIFADEVSVTAARSAQRLARVTACAMSGIPYHYLDDTTDKVLSTLPTSQTPAGMQGTSDYSSAHYTGSTYTSHFGGGSGPDGGQNDWDSNTSYGNSSHMPSPIYLTWLLEGKIYFRDLLFHLGNRVLGVGDGGYPPKYNYDDAAVGGGATYYRQWILADQPRSVGWCGRDLANALMAAADGSDEETYFSQGIKNSIDFGIAYRTYKGTDWSNLGVFQYDSGDWPASTHNLGIGYTSPFMFTYVQNSFEYMMLLHGDNATFGANLEIIADAASAMQVDKYNLLGFGTTSYSMNLRVTAMGQATTGAVYASALTNVGHGPGGSMFFAYNTNGTITRSGTDPWWTLVVGDKFQPTNWFSLSTNGTSTPDCANPPSPLVIGTMYTILTVNNIAKTFTLDNGSGGTQTFGTGPSGLGGFFYPAVAMASFPSTGFISDAQGAQGPDGYGAHLISGLAMASLRGVSGASAAYESARDRYLNGTPLDYSASAAWYMQDTV